MPRSSNQKAKILYLLKIMTEYTDEEHGLTLNEITEKLALYGINAERKTLYDDIEVLREYGLDIEKRKGKNVCYHVVGREFELPELKLLVDAVQASKFITHKKSRELIDKLAGFSSKYEAGQLRRQVFVSNRIKTMNESIYYTVDYIHEAISENVMISFMYYDWNEKKEKVYRHEGKVYVVSPWALTWDDENYYMIAYDSESGRTKHYRVDKMERIKLTDLERDGKDVFADLDMALYSKKTFGMYGGEEVLVKLRCRNDLAGKMIDRFGTDPAFIKSGEDHFEMSVRVAVSPVFLTWVMNFGGGVEVVSPDHVRKSFIDLAKDTLKIYGNNAD